MQNTIFWIEETLYINNGKITKIFCSSISEWDWVYEIWDKIICLLDNSKLTIVSFEKTNDSHCGININMIQDDDWGRYSMWAYYLKNISKPSLKQYSKTYCEYHTFQRNLSKINNLPH